MVRRVFLHIGSPKTGSTFVQRVLWSQRDRAERHGLLLPLGSAREQRYAALDLHQSGGVAFDGTPVTGWWSRALAAAAGWDGDVLFSDEHLCLAEDEQAARAVAGFGNLGAEVHVVITARDHGRQLPSLWQESVKGRSTVTLADFLDEAADPERGYGRFVQRVQGYADLARRWGAGLPAGRVHLVTVPPPGAPRDLLWQRFAGVLGLPHSDFALGVRGNESLALEQVELLRRLNAALGDRLARPGPYPAAVRRGYVRDVLAGRPGTPLVLTGADRRRAAEQAAAVVADLRTFAGLEVVGDLADLLVGEHPDGQDAQEDSGDAARPAVAEEVLLDEALEATVALLAGIAERRDRHRARVADLERRVAELEAREPARRSSGRRPGRRPGRRTWWRRTTT